MDITRILKNNETMLFVTIFGLLIVYFAFLYNIILSIDAIIMYPLLLFALTFLMFKFILKFDIFTSFRLFLSLFLVMLAIDLIMPPVMIDYEAFAQLTNGQMLSADYLVYSSLPMVSHQINWFLTYVFVPFLLLIVSRVIAPNKKSFQKVAGGAL